MKDWSVGIKIVDSLLVKSAEKKLTKTKKSFLTLVLSDGRDDIIANMWDYNEDFVPEANTVIKVLAKVGEYMGKQQLTIDSFGVEEDADIAQFLPRGNFDIEEYLQKARLLIAGIKDQDLLQLTTNLFERHIPLWKIAPSANGIHHAYLGGNLKHSVDTCCKAKAIAEITNGCNIDLCVAGAILHDIGKLFTYKFDQAIIGMTEEGILKDHIIIGIQMLEVYRVPSNGKILNILEHIIASHHGERAFGSPVTPKFAEALIVAQADLLDARLASLEEECSKSNGSHTTGKIWIFENHPMYTQEFICSILPKGEI